MPIKSGFFNSSGGDRKYDAEDVNEFFDGVVAEGVFSTVGDSFIVSVGTGLQVIVGSGRAWFLKSWIVSTSDTYHTIATADLTYDRIDVIALDFDKTSGGRENSIVVITGTPSGTPTVPALVDTATHLQIPLAYLDVAANATSFIASDLTNKVGTNDCPFATGLIDQVSTSNLLVQWRSQFDLWMLTIEQTLSQIQSGTIFNYLDDMAERPIIGRNLIINGDMISSRGYGSYPNYSASSANGDYGLIADRWKIDLDTAGVWDLSRGTWPSPTGHVDSYKLVCDTINGSLSAASQLTVSQSIEAGYFGELLKGKTEARDLYLSFDFKSNKLGTYIVQLEDEQNNWSISFEIDVASADTWTHYSYLVPRETTQEIDTSSTAKAMTLRFWFVAGSNFTSGGALQDTWGATDWTKVAYGQVNLADTVNNYVEFTNVQLEVGSLESIFERRPLYWVENLCKRYWDKRTYLHVIALAIDTTTLLFYGPPYPVRMNRAPTITYDSAASIQPAVHTLVNLDTDVGSIVDHAYRPFFTMDLSSGTVTPGQCYSCKVVGMVVDAELY